MPPWTSTASAVTGPTEATATAPASACRSAAATSGPICSASTNRFATAPADVNMTTSSSPATAARMTSRAGSGSAGSSHR